MSVFSIGSSSQRPIDLTKPGTIGGSVPAPVNATVLRAVPGSGVPTYAEGNLYWDDTDKTLAIQTEINGVTLQIGQEFYAMVTNKTGSTIVNGSVVYINGAQGNRATVALAIATSALADKIIGLCTYDIANNSSGYISVAGLVRGIDTSAWTEGTELYVSASVAGGLTSTRPAAPNHAVSIGIVTRQHVTLGEILAKVQEGASLSELHDVLVTTPADKHGLRYVNANSRWENTEQTAWLDTAQTWSAAQTFGAINATSIGGTTPGSIACTTLTASADIARILTTTTSGLKAWDSASGGNELWRLYRVSNGLGISTFTNSPICLMPGGLGATPSGVAIGATSLVSTERLRVSVGTAATSITPGATDVLIGGGEIATGGGAKFGGTIIVPKTSGLGIKVDTAAPTFPWRDQLGFPRYNSGGANAPTLTAFRGGRCRKLKFVANDRIDVGFHLDHDYVPGTDIYLHVHWLHNGTAISGNVVHQFDYTYAKGHNQASYPAEKTQSITYNTTNIATTPQYQERIEEIAISSAGGSATLLDRALFETDGIIEVSYTLNTLPSITGGDLFVSFVDLHYQSTGIGTKQKSPNFWT